jgi:hypothetical protein
MRGLRTPCGASPASVSRGNEAGAGAQEVRVGQEDLGRDYPLGDGPPRAVEIRQQAIEQRRPLDQPLGQRRELVGRQQDGHRIERPGALEAARIAVDVEGDAVLSDELARLLPPPPHLARPERVEGPLQHPPVRPHRPVGRTHLVPGNHRQRWPGLISKRRARRVVRQSVNRGQLRVSEVNVRFRDGSNTVNRCY